MVVTPSGIVLLWRSVTYWLRQRKHQLRGQLAGFLPFLRRDVTIHARSTTSAALACVSGTVTVSARAWHPSPPVDERIEALRQHVTDVEGRLNEVIRKLERLQLWAHLSPDLR